MLMKLTAGLFVLRVLDVEKVLTCTRHIEDIGGPGVLIRPFKKMSVHPPPTRNQKKRLRAKIKDNGETMNKIRNKNKTTTASVVQTF